MSAPDPEWIDEFMDLVETVRSSSYDEPIPYALTDAGWRAASQTDRRTLPAAPLLRQVQLAGGDYGLGVYVGSAEKRALERARESGRITPWMADRLAVQLLGLTLWDLWPETAAG